MLHQLLGIVCAPQRHTQLKTIAKHSYVIAIQAKLHVVHAHRPLPHAILQLPAV